MLRNLREVLTALALCAIVGILQPAASYAGTILEMNLGDATTDIEYDGTTLFTVNDGNGATNGNQDTGVQFLGILDPVASDILTPTASFSLSGLLPSGQANLIVGSVIIQNFTSGSFSLWDSSNNLLLAGTLGNSALSGSLGNTTGGLFQTSLGTVTGGSLMGYIDPNSVLLSMNFTAIKDTPSGTPGLKVSPLPGGPPPNFFLTNLSPFRADATVDIEANVPEPVSAVLVLAASAMALASLRRGGCR